MPEPKPVKPETTPLHPETKGNQRKPKVAVAETKSALPKPKPVI
ncbi:hypothetical protein [Flavobacterium sp. XGLA_31]